MRVLRPSNRYWLENLKMADKKWPVNQKIDRFQMPLDTDSQPSGTFQPFRFLIPATFEFLLSDQK